MLLVLYLLEIACRRLRGMSDVVAYVDRRCFTAWLTTIINSHDLRGVLGRLVPCQRGHRVAWIFLSRRDSSLSFGAF